VSGKKVVTERFASIRAPKSAERGTTASASIALRSVTTTPPAALTAWRICAGVVCGEKRTTVTPKGLPAAEAEPAKAHAATTAARRRASRFTVLHVSTPLRISFITRSGKAEGPPGGGPSFNHVSVAYGSVSTQALRPCVAAYSLRAPGTIVSPATSTFGRPSPAETQLPAPLPPGSVITPKSVDA
jgi:hypothetical protein